MFGEANSVVIGTRGSALALAQAHHVRELLEKAHPRLRFEMKIIKTTGDKKPELSLGSGAGKGLFTKELESALLRNRIDLAVHSLKDLPVELPAGLKLGAVPRRGPVHDVMISKTPGGLAGLPPGARVGTSSLRRKVQLLHARADLQMVEIRGNIETRLRKLVETPKLDTIILAGAGLERLGYAPRDGQIHAERLPRSAGYQDEAGTPLPVLYTENLALDAMLPAVGQGALGLEIRAADSRIASLVEAVNHYATFQAVMAERHFLLALGGGCQVPLGALATVEENRLHLRAVVFDPDGTGRRTGDLRGEPREAAELGARLAARLK